MIAVSHNPRPQAPDCGVVIGDELEAGLVRFAGIVEERFQSRVKSNIVAAGRYCSSSGAWRQVKEARAGNGEQVRPTDASVGLIQDESLYAWEFPGPRSCLGGSVYWTRATPTLSLARPTLREKVVEAIDLTKRQVIGSKFGER